MAEDMGVKVGVPKSRAAYKLRWNEWGTKNRITAKGADKGTTKATHFFFNAVKSESTKAQSVVSDAIVKSFDSLFAS